MRVSHLGEYESLDSVLNKYFTIITPRNMYYSHVYQTGLRRHKRKVPNLERRPLMNGLMKLQAHIDSEHQIVTELYKENKERLKALVFEFCPDGCSLEMAARIKYVLKVSRQSTLDFADYKIKYDPLIDIVLGDRLFEDKILMLKEEVTLLVEEISEHYKTETMFLQSQLNSGFNNFSKRSFNKNINS